MAISQLKLFHLNRKKDSVNTIDGASQIKLEKNGKTLDFIPGEVSTDRINAIQVCIPHTCT